ncbi:MAG TPA: PDZ domain-containing protein [Acidimicrobiales bacterium]|nr:PDZ domain-containing protein [Acidimicrobiales bacterium]
MPFDEDAEEGPSGFRPPPHPDDRLWRHPSEMRAHPIVRLDAPGGAPVTRGELPGRPAAPRPGRRWVTAVASGAAGAVLAGVGIVALGLNERVVDRPVIERVVLNPVATAPGLTGNVVDGVRQRVAPSVVGILAAGPGLPGSGDGDVAGSGVVVRDDGIVVTSAALAPTGVDVWVRLPDGTAVVAEVLGADPATGLSVLDLEDQGYTAAVLALEGDLVAGETAFAVSARAAIGTTTASGEVGLTQRYVGPAGTALDGVQIDGDLDALGLGSPVVDARGAVTAVTTALDDDSWYVAPVEVMRRVADDVILEGRVYDCWLGIEGTTDAPAEGLATPTSGGGTRVASVVGGSPAERAGLRAGDLVVSFDGRQIARMPDLMVALRAYRPGDEVKVGVSRADGSRETLEVTLEEPPA